MLALFLAVHSPTVVLTYHDFIEKKTVWFDCTPREFKQQVASMRKAGVHFIRSRDLYNHLSRGVPLPSRAVLLTFADNYSGFYKFAWPLLKQQGIPATLFVHTGFVGSQQGRPKMTWTQLKELSASGLVEVESQTVSHPADVEALPDAALKREMEESRAAIQKYVGVESYFLAYPNGKFGPRAVAAAKAAGYKMAFTEDCHPAETARSLWEVPRYVHTKWKQAMKAH